MVALFEFLLFYVVAMKYMAMIMEARSRAAGQPSSANDIRRRFAALQLKFYFVLLFALITTWYLGLVQYRKKFVFMTMYSFWVPQIIYNVITETKKPLHNQFIYGNSIIRLNLPLLLFGIPGNFMQEIEPELSLDFSLCWMLMIWIGIQTGLLVGQSKYGARFMIPARYVFIFFVNENKLTKFISHISLHKPLSPHLSGFYLRSMIIRDRFLHQFSPPKYYPILGRLLAMILKLVHFWKMM